jgi:hypothetical protein
MIGLIDEGGGPLNIYTGKGCVGTLRECRTPSG